MKKFIASFMCFICISLIPAVSCAKKADIPADKLSLIRYDVLVAEDDDVKIAVYLEKRESPYREDGNPAELKPHIVIKATAVDDFDIENARYLAGKIELNGRYVRRSYNRRQKIFVAIRFQTHIVFERMSSFAADSARRRSFAYNIAQRRKTNVQPRFDHKIGYNFVRGCDNKRTKLRARGSGRLLGRRKLRRDPRTRTRKRRRTVLVRRIYQQRTDRGVSRRRNNGRNGSIENRTVRKIIFAKNEYFVEFCR